MPVPTVASPNAAPGAPVDIEGPPREGPGLRKVLSWKRFAWAPVLGVVLFATAIAGPFTIDEANHVVSVMGVRHGDFALPGTDGLPPTRDLVFFDPSPAGRASLSPVVSTLPPLYPLLAWPFSFLGYRGLVLLNVLAFVALLALVFTHARRRSTHALTPWVAAGLVATGASLLEYAQGAWPHVLSAVLCTGAFVALSRSREEEGRGLALGAGLLAGVACGVRYQVVVYAGLLGLGFLLGQPRRWRAALAYAVGVGLPIGLNSLLNHARLGSWHPLSKGPAYARAPALKTMLKGSGVDGHEGPWPVPLEVFWAKVVDFRAHPMIGGDVPGAWSWVPDAQGAFTWSGGVKLAWLQSAPWIVVAFVACALAWRKPRPLGDGTGAFGDAPRVQDVRLASVVVVGTLAFFSLAGFGRFDGLSFNQRYFLELGPLAALVVAWQAERVGTWRGLVGGLGAGVVGGLVVCTTLLPGDPTRTRLLLVVPLVLAVVTWLSWLGPARRGWPVLALSLLGVGWGWSAVVHVGNDVRTSRLLRAQNAGEFSRLDEAIPDGAALLVFGATSDAASLLLFERDVVIADPIESEGRETPALVKALRAKGRRVLVDLAGFPPEVFDRVRVGSRVVMVREGADPIVELVEG